MGGTSDSTHRLGVTRLLEQRAKEILRQGRRNVFISFATEDLDEVNLLRAQSKNENNDLEFSDHSVRDPFDSERAEYIKRKISERIARASCTVVYLSASAGKSSWVKWEVETSIKKGKEVLAVHKGDRYGGKIPKWIGENRIPVIPWSGLADRLKGH